MLIRVLGPIVVESAGTAVALGGAQARCLLSALVLHAGRPASTEALIDALWGEEPPLTAAKIIHKHVSQLRKRLGSVLVTTDGGYALDLREVTVDAAEFESMLQQASLAAEPAEVVSVISGALGLWRGKPYANLSDFPAALAEVTRLEELRLAATEDLLESELELGRSSELVGRVEDLVAQYPLREKLWSHLMLALYRSGRQAEALRAYQRLRSLLAEELGIDPSPEVQALEERILNQEPDLVEHGLQSEHTALPHGTVTFLMTDIEGSTRLWEASPAAMAEAVSHHDQILRIAIASHRGHVVKGLGDGLLAAFDSAQAAAAAAVDAQRDLQPVSLLATKVRIALHSDEAELETGGDYFGLPLSRVARLVDAARGGQILLSESTKTLVDDRLPSEASIDDLGEYRLSELSQPIHIYRLQHPAVSAEFIPLRALPVTATNLPVQLTSFVGREQERSELEEILAEARVVTLIGPGGSGKTRLAVEVAAATGDVRADGVWFVDLAPLTSPEQVAITVAAPFGVSGDTGRPADAVLADYLSDRAVRLVIDNCEHVIDEVADLVARLLQAAPRLQILATSRERLGVPGEVAFEVPPLPLPDLDDVHAVGDADAVRLFVDRARASDPRFSLAGDNARTVAQVCRRLDGIPLAIELAAARVRAFSPQQLTALLDDRFALLTSTVRTGPERHRTLQAAVDWSYGLLEEADQMLFRRLSAFRGGFSLEAAQGVCGRPPLSEGEVLTRLPALVDKSLVLVDRRPEKEARYRLLETLREFGHERLADGELAELGAAHARYFATLAEEAESHLRGPDQKRSNARLAAAYDNIRAALSWSFANEPELGTRLSVAMSHYWDAVGPRVEAHKWLDRAVAASADTSPEVRIDARLAANYVFVSAELSYAIEFAREALREAEEIGDEPRQGRAMRSLCWTLAMGGNYEDAVPLGERALAIFRRLGDDWEIAWCLERLGQAEFRDPNRSLRYSREGLALWRQMGDRRRACITLYKMAERCLQGAGSLDDAERWMRESLAISDDMELTHDAAHARIVFGRVLRAQGATAAAIGELEHALESLRKQGDRRCMVRSLTALGLVRLDTGDFDAARDALEESLLLGRRLEEKITLRHAFAGLARLRAAAGDADDAVALYAAMDRLNRDLGLEHSPEVELERLRDELGADRFGDAWRRGQAMTVDEAAEYLIGARPV